MRSNQKLVKLFDLFDKHKAFSHLEYMESLGPRIPDSEAHRQLEKYIEEYGNKTVADFYRQEYSFHFNNEDVSFVNLIYIFKGKGKNKKKILLGTHYDSRIIADNEKDASKRNTPIPGINDGGSGTAVFIEFLEILNNNPPHDDVAIVFFDAEDIGNIDGFNFSEGAEYFVREFKHFTPDEVVVIDMIGGKDTLYNIDLEAFDNEKSKELLLKIWKAGISLELKPFLSDDNLFGSYFVCDHTPFVKRGIPSFLLIDILYPQWHTLEDTCKHCCPDSLEAAAKVLLTYLYYLNSAPNDIGN